MRCTGVACLLVIELLFGCGEVKKKQTSNSRTGSAVSDVRTSSDAAGNVQEAASKTPPQVIVIGGAAAPENPGTPIPPGENKPSICTPTDLAAISINAGGSYVLACDIDLDGLAWVPFVFSGSLDGQGHTIKNMKLTANTTSTLLSLGLFTSLTDGATVKNLTLSNFVLNCNAASASNDLVFNSCGALAGVSKGTVTSVTVTDVTLANNSTITADGYYRTALGGLLGTMSGGSINDCSTTGSISVTQPTGSSFGIGGGTYSGGLIGDVVGDSTISRARAAVAIMNPGGAGPNNYLTFAGGLIGLADGSATVTVADSQASGQVGASVAAGGLIGGIGAWNGTGYGQMTALTVVHSSASGLSVSQNDAGGLVGYVMLDVGSNTLNIKTSYATGGARAPTAGGLIGDSWTEGSTLNLANCYASGASGSSTTDSRAAGGLFGSLLWASGDKPEPTLAVTNCYANGAVTGSASSNDLGGWVGNFSGTATVANFTSSIWNRSITGVVRAFGNVVSSSNAYAVSSAAMSSQSTFVGWDFTNTWIMPAGGGAPQLR